MKIEERIDEYIKKVSVVGKRMEKNFFYDEGKKYYYKDEKDLLRILDNSYPDTDHEMLTVVADDIIEGNKKGNPQYIGGDPYDRDVNNNNSILGAYGSEQELKRRQKEAADDI